jgi:hypothetical protein
METGKSASECGGNLFHYCASFSVDLMYKIKSFHTENPIPLPELLLHTLYT